MVSLGMAPEAATLVRVVMEKLGVKGATALARELGMSDYSAPRRIADWLEGKYAPNYEATMLMLERAGFLRPVEAGKPLLGEPPYDPLTPRGWYLLDAADRGLPPDTLAVIFNVSEDELEAELQQTRDDLAKCEELAGQEGVDTSTDLVKELRESSAAEAFRQAGKPTLESLNSQVKGLRELHKASETELKTRIEHLEQEIRKLRAKTG